MFDLSGKYGADVELARGLLRMSAKRGFETGLVFHVGSQCLNPAAFTAGFETAAQVLHDAGTELACFDVGGGFPVEYDGVNAPPLERYLDVIREGLEALTLPHECTVMCEPGRALVASAQSLVVQVQLRKNDRLYINDGRYGSLIASSIGVAFPVRQVGTTPHSHQQDFEVLGPTCDGLDVMPAPLRLPANIREGDWLEFGFAGAYSNALRTDFNGFRPDTFVTVDAPFVR
jgi:ornithine decarboxylase